jgi:hypothetical protein
MRARNSLLQQLGQYFYAGESISAQARQIYVATMRYACSAWRFDRDRDVLPAAYMGTAKELLWRAFKSGAPMPIGERQLRTILAASRRAGPKGARAPATAQTVPAGISEVAQASPAQVKA